MATLFSLDRRNVRGDIDTRSESRREFYLFPLSGAAAATLRAENPVVQSRTFQARQVQIGSLFLIFSIVLVLVVVVVVFVDVSAVALVVVVVVLVVSRPAPRAAAPREAVS